MRSRAVPAVVHTRVAVVVDSSAGIPAKVAAAQGITVEPIKVFLDGDQHCDLDVGAEDVLTALKAEKQVGTASPEVEDFAATYRMLADHGVDEIVSIHVGAQLAGTTAHAMAAAEQLRAEAGPTVHVVDSLSTAMGLGWVALTAAGAAASGMPGAGVRDIAVRTAMRTTALFTVQELEHLRRYGRISGGQSAIGSALGIRPVFRLQRGELTPAGKMRGGSRAIDRMVELAEDSGRGWPAHVTVLHAGAAQDAEQLVGALAGSRLQVRGATDIVTLPPSVVAQTGPVVGVVVSPTDWD